MENVVLMNVGDEGEWWWKWVSSVDGVVVWCKGEIEWGIEWGGDDDYDDEDDLVCVIWLVLGVVVIWWFCRKFSMMWLYFCEFLSCGICL